jgi:hypothetical protein
MVRLPARPGACAHRVARARFDRRLHIRVAFIGPVTPAKLAHAPSLPGFTASALRHLPYLESL